MEKLATKIIDVCAIVDTDGIPEEKLVKRSTILARDKKTVLAQVLKAKPFGNNTIDIQEQFYRLPVIPNASINDFRIVMSKLPTKEFSSLRVTFQCPYNAMANITTCPDQSGDNACHKCKHSPCIEIISVINRFAVNTR